MFPTFGNPATRQASQYFSDSIDTYFMVTNLTTGCISDTMNITTSVAEKPTLECLTNTYDFCENTSITITESGVLILYYGMMV